MNSSSPLFFSSTGDVAWNIRFSAWKNFAERSANSSSEGSAADRRILAWVTTQRTAYRKGTLRADRRLVLESAGFEWTKAGDPSWDESWEAKLAEWVDFTQNHSREPLFKGDTPKERTLAAWVTKQRSRYRNGFLSDDKVRRLVEVGFKWLPGQYQASVSKFQNDLQQDDFYEVERPRMRA